jgi:Tol biopolymer transport system component
MSLTVGTRLGPYDVIAPLGAGGMGEVHRARDSRLGRDVAIKALPAEFSQDPERLARFEREARLLASLSHPNIAGIHGLEEVAGARYLVLEFIEGETLAARLSRGALPLDEAIEVAKQIAAGVEVAHESGVVHRDLKPGNLMLTPSGAVKVLDFGLAKSGATDRTGSDANLSVSPTMTYAATQAGVILGTAAYMSPEQARGRVVDRRTDIWSFGCVLYECLTGRQAFAGETVSDLLARILEREPDWSALPATTPPRLRELLQRCLRKDARERLRDIGEARIALDEMSKGVTTAEGERAGVKPARRSPVAFQIGLALLAAIIAVLATRLVSRPPAPLAVALSVMLPSGERLEGGLENNVLAIAPDGRSLVYAAQGKDAQRLFLRRLDGPEIVEMPGTSDARNPFFSPDGEWVGFFSGRHLLKASVRGGTPVEVTEVAADRGGTWLGDGSIVYSPTFAAPLYRIGANGGERRQITTLDSTRSERTHRWPCALPGGEWVVFTVGVINSPGGYDDANIEAVSMRNGERRVLAHGACARYAPGKQLIFARSGSLYAMPIDPGNPHGGATAVPVLDGVLGASTSGAAFFDIARDGTLAVVPGREGRKESRLAWVDRDGNRTLLPGEPRKYSQLDLSPDGTRVLAQIGAGGGNDDVFLVDLARGSANQITFGGHSGSAKWLPDGRHIAWSRNTDAGGSEIVMRSLSGDDSARVLTRSSLPLGISDVLKDGSALLFSEYGSVQSDVMEVPTNGSGAVRPIVLEPLSQASGVLSPDGRWVAYVSDETGMREVCVRPVGRTGGRVQISPNGGTTPMWAHDGRELYYRSGGGLVVATVTVRGETALVDSTRRLFDLPLVGGDSSVRDFAMHPSGEKFLVRVAAGETNEMREVAVRLNWAASLGSKTRESAR